MGSLGVLVFLNFLNATYSIDVLDLRPLVKYEGGYSDLHSTIRNFWLVVNDFSARDKAALLKFITSCSKVKV